MLRLVLLSALSLVCFAERPTVPDILRKWGYPSETVNATTEDGYVLEMHRIPPKDNSPRPVVFLHHGLFASSEIWLRTLPNNSLGFILSDAGFDVWLGNSRGNRYSKHHLSLNSSSEEFWEFSWDEMALYDTPAMINTILNRTGQKSLYYIGHSQGTTVMFGALAEDPDFASKIRSFFALAPVATMAHSMGKRHQLAGTVYMTIKDMPKMFGSAEFCPSNDIIRMIKAKARLVKNSTFCADILELLARTVPNKHCTPLGTSTRNILHWLQMAISGRMQSYRSDSLEENRLKFRSYIPKFYDISTITVDTYLYWSDADVVADPQDVQEGIVHKLSTTVLKGNNQLKHLGHTGFIGPNVVYSVYAPIIRTILDDLKKL